ncbi:MAG: GGDEF domain-containing protein [Marinobacter sp.]|uniref:GGDEF domain-containing protein n=1 Tax=Marinobacter sp. TaxID=50741 RepID=UPI00299F0A1C|nr:GGDEF domain-containing protein [Marinobacter sp.]MDX1633979.1 GGDEF domain-containing protein [Marinobacter sp.]
MLYRLRHNFRLSIITLMGVCAILGITPFAIFRFIDGNVMAGLVDTLILLGICTAMVYAWVTGDTRRSGFVLALVACGGGVAVASVLGNTGLFWLYPPFITSFFLTSPRVAMIINGGALMVLVSFGIAFQSAEHMLSFITTALVVSACAYIFALRNESQRHRLEQLATLDPLTGVKNRRAMEQELKAAVATRERNGLSFALALVDLDHFKRVNDVHGHGIGDEVLINCAEIIRCNTRQSDQLFRFGGEEFVLLLPGVEDADMRVVMANLHKALRRELRCPGGPVTASYGLALLKPGETADQWLARADEALYEAKESGRDRICVAGSEALAEAV